jgi:hypothetical protein
MLERKEFPNFAVVIDGDVKVDARGKQARMSSGGSNFCQRPAARQGVADEGVPAVMNR